MVLAYLDINIRSYICMAVFQGVRLKLLSLATPILLKSNCGSLVIIPTVSTQDGDSAVIVATLEQQPATLRELVRAGSDLNLQNQVRYTVTVDTVPHIIPSCPY